MPGEPYHTDGWVNCVLGYFGGLLNFYAAKESIPIYTLRRQSFGFLRTTLTDTKQSIRLSLGGLPEVYTNIVIDAIRHLEREMYGLNFKLMKEALKIVESDEKKSRVGIFFETSQVRSASFQPSKT